MNLSVIVAMRKELDLLLPLLDHVNIMSADSQMVYQGNLGKHRIVAMQCGIGKVNAALGTQTIINHFSPDYVINTGVAGGADNSVRIMDVVIGRQVAYHDVWCGPESPWGMVQGLPLYYEADKRLLDAVPTGGDIKVGLICSGDQFIDTAEKIRTIKGKFPHALAVDMESAAIAQVCHLRKTGFMSLRIISDSPTASHDNTRQYVDFWEDAPRHTFAIVEQLLHNL